MGFWQLNATDSAALASDRTALKALDTSLYQSAFLTESGRAGAFEFRSGDYSASITADTLEGLYIKADDTASSAGAWVRVYTGAANVKWFGAKGDNSAADLPSLQAATDLVQSVFIPNGTYKTDGPWILDNYATLQFESLQAKILTSNTDNTSAIIKSRGGASFRNFFITITSGTLQGPSVSGAAGVDWLATSYGRIDGTFFSFVSDGIRIGGSGSLGAFYNSVRNFIITDTGVGIRCGTLGNSNDFRVGRIGSCTVGTSDDDNTCNTYDAIAIEGFTSVGHRVSSSGVTSQRTRYLNSRLENSGGVGAGIVISAAAESTVVFGEFHTGLASGVTDSGSNTDIVASY